MSQLLVAQRALTVPGWAKDALWRSARAVPSLDLRFADNKSLVDAVTGASLITFTRASSGTFVSSDGVLQTASTDVPRFDHNPITGESLGLLVEEQRTNLQIRSEEFDTATYTKQRVTIAADSIAAPNGTITADKCVEDTSTLNSHFFSAPTVSCTSGQAYTLSIFVKAGERNRFRMQLGNNGTPFPVTANHIGIFDVATGLVVSAGSALVASITPFANGWYRCSITATAQGTAVESVFPCTLISSGTTIAYTGDGVSGLFLWGAQLEAGAFPTSYIPTTTAAATRSADVASITGTAFSSWYRQDEGTMFVEGITNDSTALAFRLLFQTNDATASNRIQVSRNNSTGNARLAVIAGGVAQAATDSTAWTLGTRTRLGLGYATNNFALSANGGSTATDSLGTVPSVTQLALGQDYNITNILNGTILRICYWPTRLANSTLQGITQ